MHKALLRKIQCWAVLTVLNRSETERETKCFLLLNICEGHMCGHIKQPDLLSSGISVTTSTGLLQ